MFARLGVQCLLSQVGLESGCRQYLAEVTELRDCQGAREGPIAGLWCNCPLDGLCGASNLPSTYEKFRRHWNSQLLQQRHDGCCIGKNSAHSRYLHLPNPRSPLDKCSEDRIRSSTLSSSMQVRSCHGLCLFGVLDFQGVVLRFRACMSTAAPGTEMPKIRRETPKRIPRTVADRKETSLRPLRPLRRPRWPKSQRGTRATAATMASTARSPPYPVPRYPAASALESG